MAGLLIALWVTLALPAQGYALPDEVAQEGRVFDGDGRLKFGHTIIDRMQASLRDVVASKADSGWLFGGHGGVASRSHTTLGPGVAYHDTPRIECLD